jgi:hypothetical protein
MNQTTILNKAGHISLVLCVLFLFLNANIIPKSKYTPYQILVWEIKANEGYRSWWYKDGFNRGKQSYSIGFGWNDLGNRRREEIAQYTADGKVTFDEATEITLKEIKKYGTLNKDPYKNVALQLYSYNCGLTKDGSKLGRCCGGTRGCGSSNANIRNHHNSRRKFELALWNHDIMSIEARTEKNREKLKAYLQILKARGEL